VSEEAGARFRELLAYAAENEDVLGVFLIGSRALEGFADDSSDYDVGVVVRDEGLEAFDARWPHDRGAPVEVLSTTLDDLRAHAEHGTPTEWARYAYATSKLLIDRTGEVGAVLAEKARLPEDLAREIAAEAIDAFVNSTHRSLRNRARGLERAATLDASESVPYLMTALFALHGRVRPYNKYLEWELRERPLDESVWAAETLLPRIDRIVTGDEAEQRAMFRDLEQLARRRGLGEVIDSWEPDVVWLRGESPKRGP
jgi:hypothetical protein